jgi:hypothetical protein
MKNFRGFIFIVLLVLASLACGTGDLTSLLNPLPSDDFSSSSSGWGTGTDSYSSVNYSNDGLTMQVFEPLYVTWSTPSITSYENVHLEVDIQNQSSDDKAMFGFICNEQGSTNAFYYAGVSPDGYYAFIKSSVVGEDEYLKDGFSDVVTANLNSLRLGLDCTNGSMTLYVNGHQIDNVSDSSYTSGSVGLFLASQDQRNGAAVIFDNFATTKLGK